MPTTEPITLPWCLVLHLYQTLGLKPEQFGLLLLGGILIIIAAAYLLGGISPSIIISRRVLHDDVRRRGSGNAGATNMLRNYGAKFAVLTLFLDILKTAIAMAIGYLIYQKDGAALAGLFAVLGHIFPIYYRFRGGKGFACATAVALLMLHPIAFAILLVCYMGILFSTKYVSLSSVMVVLIFPMIQHAFHPEEGTGFLCALLIAVFVVFMHRENIKRLYNREESKIDFSKFRKKKKAQDAAEDGANDE
jgi:glycerol-3-phosphate acyltransferase PlsY